MHGPELRVLPSVLALVDEEYSMVFQDEHSLLYSEAVTLDEALRHSIRQGTLYRLLCQHVVNFRDIFGAKFQRESQTWINVKDREREHEASLKITLMEEVSGVLFIPGLRVSIHSASALDDVGFFVAFQRCLIFTYPEGVDPVWMGHSING